MIDPNLANHPYWNAFKQRIGPVVEMGKSRGFIQPQEVPVIQQIVINNEQQCANFVQSLITRYPKMDMNTMDHEISQFLGPAVQQARQYIRQQMMSRGGCCGGSGMFSFGSPSSGFGFDVGIGGGQVQTNGGSMFSGGTGSNTPFGGSGIGSGGQIISRDGGVSFGGSQTEQRKQYVQEQMRAPEQKKEPPKPWAEPVKDENGGVRTENVNGVDFSIAKFDLSSGDIARRVIVHDPKVCYISDKDIIEKYKSVFSLFQDSKRKFLTVAYKQLKLINCGREEFMKIASAMSQASLKAADVESKLRAIIATMKAFHLAEIEAFTNLFLDELNEHMVAGGLVDSKHLNGKNTISGTYILDRPDSIQMVLGWVSGDFDKDMNTALRSQDGYADRLVEIVGNVITQVVEDLPKIIINTNVDLTMLDDFVRLIPGIWSKDLGATFSVNEDLFDIFLATRETIERSKTENAERADSALKSKLKELNSQFSMIFVPRVVSWCNYSKNSVCEYDQKGNCLFSAFSVHQPRNDVEFFVKESITNWEACKDTRIKMAPKHLYCEIDEETYHLRYGRTTDNLIVIGQAAYWN